MANELPLNQNSRTEPSQSALAGTASTSTASVARQSSRLSVQEKPRVLDNFTKKRRLEKHLEILEKDNVQDDPHANITWHKAAPKFADELLSPTGSVAKAQRKRNSIDGPQQSTLNEIGSKKGKILRAKLTTTRFRKTFDQMLEEEQKFKDQDPEAPTYSEVSAPPSAYPARKFCSVCGLFSKYTCVKCSAKFCSIPCKSVHVDTRCLKWTS
ncbi:HIT zinc finger domain-containing protein [Ditylenchus destructor]|nr:HIT zinc finger domain-containing protein [Ditylenchus destructor]